MRTPQEKAQRLDDYLDLANQDLEGFIDSLLTFEENHNLLERNNVLLRGVVQSYLDGPSTNPDDAIPDEIDGLGVLLTPKQWLDRKAIALLNTLRGR